MKIWLLFDYDDRVIRASCDGVKLQKIADEMNGPVDFGPYWVTDVELEDMFQQKDSSDCEHDWYGLSDGHRVFECRKCDQFRR